MYSFKKYRSINDRDIKKSVFWVSQNSHRDLRCWQNYVFVDNCDPKSPICYHTIPNTIFHAITSQTLAFTLSTYTSAFVITTYQIFVSICYHTLQIHFSSCYYTKTYQNIFHLLPHWRHVWPSAATSFWQHCYLTL